MAGADLRGQLNSFSGIGRGTSYPNPFDDIASMHMPTGHRSVMHWCEHVYSMFGTYSMAMDRVISYFLTDIDILNASEDEKDKWTDFHDNTLHTVANLKDSMRNRMCYGNDYSSVIVPFIRWLTCPKCGYSAPLKQVFNGTTYQFDWQLPKFIASCPTCKVGSGYRGEFIIDDRDDDLEKKIKIKRWNVHEIEILHDSFTEDCAYLWRIPEDYKKQVRQKNLFHLERVSEQVLKAIEQNVMFRFNPDVIFHMKEPTLSGVCNRGWGIPRILSNFRQIWYVQVLRRFNEAIALDYVIPFRIITPGPPQGGSGSKRGGMGISGDPLLTYSGLDLKAQINQMIRKRARDPGSIQVLPFPVNFQMFGADANKLAPRDLLDQGTNQLLNDVGTPVELYNGSLQLQTAPVALRLFESTWHHLVHDANQYLRWLVRQVSQILNWETTNAILKRVTIADNLEKQMMAAQLMMSQQLSATTVLRDLGYNWLQEQKQLGEEAQTTAKLQARTQELMQQQGFAEQIAKGQGGDPNAQGGQPAQGGGDPSQQPMGGAMGTSMQGPVTQYLASMGPNTPTTPADMLAAADMLANELMGLPETVKDSELRKLKMSNEPLHSMVRARIDAKREEFKNQGGAALMQQQQQGGGQPPPA